MSDASTPPPGPFHYWDYPEPGPTALAMIESLPVRAELQGLLDNGDAEAIEQWLARAEVPEAVKAVVRRGLRGEDLFDAVEVASLHWYDRCGTYTVCLARRAGNRVWYEVWQDGDRLSELESDVELTGPELRNLMAKGDIDDEDYEYLAAFVASSQYHDDLADFAGWTEQDEGLRNKFIEGGEFPGHDFAWADLTGIAAARANLESASFYRASLAGADLFAAQLRHADLRYVELGYAVLQSAELEGAQLQGADLRNADLRFANLRNAKLCGADLRKADLRHANTRGADFSGANLTDCRW